jgi:hypothetical protein
VLPQTSKVADQTRARDRAVQYGVGVLHARQNLPGILWPHRLEILRVESNLYRAVLTTIPAVV